MGGEGFKNSQRPIGEMNGRKPATETATKNVLRGFMAVHGARQKIHEAVLCWPRWISGSGLIDLMEKFIQRGDCAPASLWRNGVSFGQT